MNLTIKNILEFFLEIIYLICKPFVSKHSFVKILQKLTILLFFLKNESTSYVALEKRIIKAFWKDTFLLVSKILLVFIRM